MSERDPQCWRLIDTGLRPAAQNLAINRAMLEAHQAGLIPHTLRFLRFEPCALLGFHQNVDQELRSDYCRDHNITIQRRITGGGAIYFDETQIGWELYLDKGFLATADMAQIARRVCEAAAQGMRRLGVEATFRPRNDIEVDGRKISGTGGAFDGDSILYQGTLLVDFDIEKMLQVLRIPAQKRSDKAIASARERVTNLKELLGVAPELRQVKAHLRDAFAEAFSIRFEETSALSEAEERLYREALREIDTAQWVFQANRSVHEAPTLEGLHRCAGGLMRASVMLDTFKQRIKQVWISGDFFINPKRMVLDLEAALRDTALSELNDNITRFFADYPVEMLMLKADDFYAVVANALHAGDGAVQAGA